MGKDVVADVEDGVGGACFGSEPKLVGINGIDVRSQLGEIGGDEPFQDLPH